MTNEAFARVKIDALLAAQGWDVVDTNAVPFEVQRDPWTSSTMQPASDAAALRRQAPMHSPGA